MTGNDNKILDMISDNIKTLREDMTRRFDKIDHKFDTMDNKINKLVTEEDCKKNRVKCEQSMNNKSEVSIKRISAIGGVITASLAALATFTVAILKVFYP